VTTFVEHMPLLALRKNPFDEATNQFVKRGFDIIFSLLVIVLIMSWLTPIIALLIKLSSPGPVFFSQERSGIQNKSFKCFKFRSMRTENNSEFKQATKNDTRVTKIGSFLRKTSLDELPQFFNVLLGNMSIVGPRPHPLKLTEEYSQKVDRYMVRHLVKPGITGLSQVMGYRGETQHDLYLMKMRVRMDRFYIDNWSFYLDLKVVWATILLMFRKDTNAY
jgi:putative colanic acid biosynthesis UDP-glucose lipid carrier transferase